MNLSMQFKDYLTLFSTASNEPLTLQKVLVPFGVVGAPAHEDPYILVGHLLDGLAMEFLDLEDIDASDVIKMAEDLGVEI
ncbi:MAG: hypothetical protein NT027_12515 [Proteobacteria bacterium]|nr:hypothetical protein [Pseudomonadota bacterium]